METQSFCQLSVFRVFQLDVQISHRNILNVYIIQTMLYALFSAVSFISYSRRCQKFNIPSIFNAVAYGAR